MSASGFRLVPLCFKSYNAACKTARKYCLCFIWHFRTYVFARATETCIFTHVEIHGDGQRRPNFCPQNICKTSSKCSCPSPVWLISWLSAKGHNFGACTSTACQLGDYAAISHHQEPDILVRSVRPKMPHVGYRVMRGQLRAAGCWVKSSRFQHPGEYIPSRVPLCWSA